jgi:hypothetical protein
MDPLSIPVTFRRLKADPSESPIGLGSVTVTASNADDQEAANAWLSELLLQGVRATKPLPVAGRTVMSGQTVNAGAPPVIALPTKVVATPAIQG